MLCYSYPRLVTSIPGYPISWQKLRLWFRKMIPMKWIHGSSVFKNKWIKIDATVPVFGFKHWTAQSASACIRRGPYHERIEESNDTSLWCKEISTSCTCTAGELAIRFHAMMSWDLKRDQKHVYTPLVKGFVSSVITTYQMLLWCMAMDSIRSSKSVLYNFVVGVLYCSAVPNNGGGRGGEKDDHAWLSEHYQRNPRNNLESQKQNKRHFRRPSS